MRQCSEVQHVVQQCNVECVEIGGKVSLQTIRVSFKTQTHLSCHLPWEIISQQPIEKTIGQCNENESTGDKLVHLNCAHLTKPTGP